MVAALAEAVTEIPGLPDALRYVPPAPSNASDPDADLKRANWHEWAEALARYRLRRKQQIEQNPDLIPLELAKCRLSPAYFMAVWGWIFEPRPEYNPGDKPWLPFAIQIELLDWFEECMAAMDHRRDGVVSKSRDMGASWVTCCWLLHGWLFKYPWNVLILSRKEDLVESRDPDSLFWKIEFLIALLPSWMVPEGFSLKNKKYNTDLLLTNPATGATIKGESTNSTAGRGGRYAAIVVDEAAFVPDFLDIWAGLSASSNHRFAVSSESLRFGNGFYSLGTGNKTSRPPSFFAMDWYDHPKHDQEWLDAERDRFEAMGKIEDFHQEYLRDARAGTATWVYPSAMDCEIVPNLDLIDMGHLYASIDTGFGDQTAIVWIQEQNGKYAVLGGYQNRGKPAAFYGTIITGKPREDTDWQYTARDYEFMEWTASLPPEYLKNRSFFGDVSGHSVTGTTADSWYSVLERDFGIHINKDRMADGQAVGFRKEARTHKGRIESLRQLIPSMIFADSRNAPFVLKCLQENQFAPETGRSTTEARSPLHDDTSHAVTACEYWAVHLKLRHQLQAFGKKRSEQIKYQNSRDLSPANPNRRDFGRRRMIGSVT